MHSSNRQWIGAIAVAAMVTVPLVAEAQSTTPSSDGPIGRDTRIGFVRYTTAQPIPRTVQEVRLDAIQGPTPFGRLHAASMARGCFDRACSSLTPVLIPSTALSKSAAHSQQQPKPSKHGWIGRHPILFGTMVGFGAGFLIGYLPGDDGVFEDFTAEFNGLVLGGVGAGAGAAIGAVAGAATK